MSWSRVATLVLFALILHKDADARSTAERHTWARMRHRRDVSVPAARLSRTLPQILALRGGEDEETGNATRGTGNCSLQTALLLKEGFLGRTPIKEILKAGHEAVDTEVSVCGWARTIRIQGAGTFAFIELNDGSSFQSLQVNCCVHPDMPSDY